MKELGEVSVLTVEHQMGAHHQKNLWRTVSSRVECCVFGVRYSVQRIKAYDTRTRASAPEITQCVASVSATEYSSGFSKI